VLEGHKSQFSRASSALGRQASGILMLGALAGLAVAFAGYLMLQERKQETRMDDAVQSITVAADRVGDAAEKVANRLAR
jgi:hypothetical protein